MKKFLGIFISSIYLTLVTVQVINFHYCHGKLQSVSILKAADKCCGSNDICASACCKDVQLTIEIASEQLQPKQIIFENTASQNCCVVQYSFNILVYQACDGLVVSKYTDKPPIITQKAYLRYHSLVFYG